MSLDSFKKQAGRLASYLSKNHRVNIKHASALEAIAAAHGARSWPTLAYYTESWLKEHLLNCERTFDAGVFINVVEDGRLPLILDLHRDPERAAADSNYNLLGGLSSEEVCDVLMHAYPGQPKSTASDHIRSICRSALTRILPKELPPHEPLSLSSILQALRPAALQHHMAADPQLAAELNSLALVSSGGRADGERLMWALDRAFGPLTNALHRLKDSEYGPALFSSKNFAHGSRSVVDCFVRGDRLHVTLPDDEKHSVLRGMWMEVMHQAIRRKAATAGAREKPVVLGVDRCQYFVGPVLESLATQGRGQNLVLLLSTGSELELRQMPVGQRILANTQNRLRLGPPTAEEIDQVLWELEQSTARLRTTSGTSFA